MIWLLSLLLVATPADPRPRLVELQMAAQPEAALRATEQALAADPTTARPLGLDYLRGHLLEVLCRPREAAEAFVAAMSFTPDLRPFARYRLARIQTQLGHPEVAAGILATLLGGGPPASVAGPAARLLADSIAAGGDCRLLGGGWRDRLAPGPRRRVALAAADCALREGEPGLAARELVTLLAGATDDEVAREAAERLAQLPESQAEPRTVRLLGITFHDHREFERAVEFLTRSLPPGQSNDEPALTTEYLLARSRFWLGEWDAAGRRFAHVAARAGDAARRATALYQQGRCRELAGDWAGAAETFRAAHAAAPRGEWGATALLSALRLDWRGGREERALATLAQIGAIGAFGETLSRAALFLAASDLVQGRVDRASGWLAAARARTPADTLEVDYWGGRAAELAGRPGTAVEAYLGVLRQEPDHPLAESARRRLASPRLAAAAQARAGALAAREPPDWYGAWLLWSGTDPRAEGAHEALRTRLARDPRWRPWLRIAPVPPGEWPVYRLPPRQPEDRLLALGLWVDGLPAVARDFPVDRVALAWTAGDQLIRAGETRRGLAVADSTLHRLPAAVPLSLVARELQLWSYPRPYASLVDQAASRHRVDPDLLLALIREESRFDPQAYSAASARGLTQFVFSTARRLASQQKLGSLSPRDLEAPDLSIALGAAYLAELEQRFGGADPAVVAAYNAGEAQAALWQRYCFSNDPDEYFTKIAFKETRAYVARVLESRRRYRELYPVPAPAP